MKGSNLLEFLKEFMRQYDQSTLIERHFLDKEKSDFFLLAVDEALEDRLFTFLTDSTIKGGFANK